MKIKKVTEVVSLCNMVGKHGSAPIHPNARNRAFDDKLSMFLSFFILHQYMCFGISIELPGIAQTKHAIFSQGKILNFQKLRLTCHSDPEVKKKRFMLN